MVLYVCAFHLAAALTMSLFVDSLAYTDPDLVDRGKIAILMGSVAAALFGSLLILLFSKKSQES